MSPKDCISPLRGSSPFRPASRLSYGLVCVGLILLAKPVVLEADTNMAQGKPATQSSTLPGYPTAVAASAVDGNTSGNWSDGSVTATNLDTNAWWQVDLGSSATVNSVVVFNRTDCCASRLNDYWVFVSIPIHLFNPPIHRPLFSTGRAPGVATSPLIPIHPPRFRLAPQAGMSGCSSAARTT